MFAVVKTGGKQVRVAKDDRITVEKIVGEPGAMIELDTVLMVGEDGKAPTVGAPAVDKAKVFAEVVEQKKSDKVVVFKKNRRKNYRRTKGHRQEQTVLKILEVSPTGTKPKAPAKAKTMKKDEGEARAKAKEADSKAAAPKKTPAKKTPAEKADAGAKPAAEKNTAAKKPAAKKAPAKKPAAKKPATKKDTEE